MMSFGGLGIFGQMLAQQRACINQQHFDHHMYHVQQRQQAALNELTRMYEARPEPKVKTVDVPFEVIRTTRADMPSFCHLTGHWL